MAQSADIIIVGGAGPVGLLCAILAVKLDLKVLIFDRKAGPLQMGRADALNARTLQLLDYLDLLEPLWERGQPCNTSSVFANGEFKSRNSEWWDSLVGCEHKCFLMIGQAFIEQHFHRTLCQLGVDDVHWQTEIKSISREEGSIISVIAEMANNSDAITTRKFSSRYLIGADGAHSFVRKYFEIPFAVTALPITWAVLDGEIDSDFPKCPEIIVFQQATADVAWIPREHPIDRFYVRIDRLDFTESDAIQCIKSAMSPYRFDFKTIHWFSHFTGVADQFSWGSNVFLAGDACHTHSVNGGQGLNTGLADAFNLIWKLNLHHRNKKQLSIRNSLLDSYELERKPVAHAVIESSGALVRATKYRNQSTNNNHAEEYVHLVKKYADYITGMGIRYASPHNQSINIGFRLMDFQFRFDSLDEWKWFYKSQFARWNGKFHLISFSDSSNANNIDNEELAEVNWLVFQPSMVKEYKQLELLLSIRQHGNHLLVRPDMYVSGQGFHIGSLMVKNNSK